MIDIDKCQLTCYPAEILTRRAQDVETIDANLREFVDKMIDILEEKKGIGLAAPQAGVSLRLFIVSLAGTRDSVKVYINPVLSLDGPIECNEEGCLSFPGIYFDLHRPRRVGIKYLDLDGSEHTLDADGVLARVILHEFDHLEGKLFIDLLTEEAREKVKKLMQQRNITPTRP